MTWSHDAHGCEYKVKGKKCGKPISNFVRWHNHGASWIGEKLHASDGGYPDYKKLGSMEVCLTHFKIIQKRLIQEHQGHFLYCDWCGRIIPMDENWDGNKFTKCCKGYHMEILKDIILCENCNHPVAEYQDKWLHKTFFNICNERELKCPECECTNPVPKKGRQVIDKCISDRNNKCGGCYDYKKCFGIEEKIK